MAFSEYVLLVSLSAGIHAHTDTGGIAIGPEAITQPNGGVTPAAVKVADKHKGITPSSAYSKGAPAASKLAPTAIPPSPTNARPPAFRSPAIRLK